MEEKELSFELPVHREFYSENVSGRRFHIFDAKGNLIAYDIAEADADFICLACNNHKDLVEACQGAIVIVNEVVNMMMDDFVAAKQLSPFPHPPLEGIKTVVRKAGGEIYETAKELEATLAKEVENENRI